MNKVFADNIGQFILVYLDDIMVFSRNLEEHWKHLWVGLGIAQEGQAIWATLQVRVLENPGRLPRFWSQP